LGLNIPSIDCADGEFRMATIGTRLFTIFKGEFVGRDEFDNRYYR